MKIASQKSVEPNVADLVNGWLKAYGLDYKLEQESLNPQIDKALEEYYSKSGGVGGNRPDAKLLLRDACCDSSAHGHAWMRREGTCA